MACSSIHHGVLLQSSNPLTLYIKFTICLIFYLFPLSLPSTSANLVGLFGGLTHTSSPRDLSSWSLWLSDSLDAAHVDLLSSVGQEEAGDTSGGHLGVKCVLFHQNVMATFLLLMIRANYPARVVTLFLAYWSLSSRMPSDLRSSQSLKFIRILTVSPGESILPLGTRIIRPTGPRFGANDLPILQFNHWDSW